MYSSVITLSVLLFAGHLTAAADDLATAYQSLQEAVPKKDPDQIKKLAAETSAIARQVIAAPVPTDPDEKAAAVKQKAFAQEVATYAEYALYATAIQSEPAVLVDLLATLEEQNPKSKYLDDAYGPYFNALHQTGEGAKVPAVAAKAIKNLPNNEDLLIYLSDQALNRKQVAVAATYSERLIAILPSHPKPEGMSQADWDRKKSLALGRAYWTAGLAHGEKQDHFQCDKDFRAALPYIKDQPMMLAAAYFYLGVANYNIGRAGMIRAQVLEGAKFSEQCAAIRSPYQQQAWTNAHAMKTEADRMVARK